MIKKDSKSNKKDNPSKKGGMAITIPVKDLGFKSDRDADAETVRDGSISIVERNVSGMYKAKTQTLNLDDLFEAPEEWNFYGKIAAEKMAELIESITQVGILHPIVVWEQGTKYMILSGHNRVAAFKTLRDTVDSTKYSVIPAVIKTSSEITGPIAQQIIIDTNWVQRDLTPMQKSKSIMAKYVYLRDTEYSHYNKFDINEMVASQYGITGRHLLRYKSLDNLIGELKTAIDDKKISMVVGVQISKLREDIQAYVYDNYVMIKSNKKMLAQNYKLLTSDIVEVTKVDDLLRKDVQDICKFEIGYPDTKQENVYKKAYLQCPADDVQYFKSLLEDFCGQAPIPSLNTESVFSNGDFFYRQVE